MPERKTQYYPPAEPLHGAIRNPGMGPSTDTFILFDKRRKAQEARETLSGRGIGPAKKNVSPYLANKGIGPSPNFFMSPEEMDEDWDASEYYMKAPEAVRMRKQEQKKQKSTDFPYKPEHYTIRDM